LCTTVLLQLNKVEMCFNESHICLCLWENRGTNKYIPGLSMELAKVGSFDCPHQCDDPKGYTFNNFLSFKCM
jgi:hypothetical protein